MYARFMADHQIRNAADAMLNGVQRTQATAIQRNAPVCLVIDPTTGSGGWQIVENDDALGCHEAIAPDPAPTNPIQVYKLADGAANAVVAVDATILRFDGFGRIVPNDPASATLSCVKVTNPTGTRPLNVAVSSNALGVGTKLCDPDPTLPAGDPMTCPANCK
jgi:hypothetical protein